PAVEAYTKLGLLHQVVDIADISPIYVTNIRLLMQARSYQAEQPTQFEKRALAALSSQSTMTIARLAASLGTKDLTPILHMIDKGVLHVDLRNRLLASPEST